MTETELREKHKIPTEYSFCENMPRSKHFPDVVGWFSFCDSTIAIYDNGKAVETHMGCNVSEGHCFISRPWEG